MLDVGVGGGPTGDADAHGGVAVPLGGAAPAGAFGLDIADDALGFFGSAEGDEDLVQDDFIEDVKAGAAQPLCEELGLAAVSFDEIAEAVATERAAGLGVAAATATGSGRAIGNGTICSTATGCGFGGARLATAIGVRDCFGAASSLTSSASLWLPNSRAKILRFGRVVAGS